MIKEWKEGKTPGQPVSNGDSVFLAGVYALDSIMQSYISGYIYSALVDSFCSEQQARMTAMDGANRNAEKLLRELSVQYNRVRQSAITMSITEVSAGAQAQRKKSQNGV